jgi:hypothetical protein
MKGAEITGVVQFTDSDADAAGVMAPNPAPGGAVLHAALTLFPHPVHTVQIESSVEP